MNIFKSNKPLMGITLGLIGISISLLMYSLSIQKNISVINPKQPDRFWKEQYWEDLIDEKGRQEAYTELKRQSANWAYLPTHQALHSFGFALYNKFGPSGISICDDYQRFGCYHGVIAAYISNEGLSALEKIDPICSLSQPSAQNRCFHGIGHGLVDYLGKSNLNQALIYCQNIDSLTYLGCPQGAIMEYFAPINTQSKNIAYEPFNEKHVLGPCEKLNKEFQKFCYFFIPSFYWPDSVSADSLKAEMHCSTILDSFFKQICLAGVGSRASNRSNFNLDKAQNICLKMKDRQNQINCLAGAQWNRGNNNPSESICSLLGESAVQNCISISEELNN